MCLSHKDRVYGKAAQLLWLQCERNMSHTVVRYHDVLSSREIVKPILNMDSQRLGEAFASGWNYTEYRKMLQELLAEGKTTGADQSEGMINYATINQKRMDRGDKTVKVSDEVQSELNEIQPNEKWLVITEGWCGDASQIIPALAKLEEAAPGVEMKLILRDENLDVMDAFLTDGSRGIPKLVRLDANTNEVIGEWGPRPAAMQEIVNDWKKTKDVPKEEMYVVLHGAYAKNRGAAVLSEMMEELKQSQSAIA